MPVPDTTPARRLVIRRGLITYIVDEAKYDTVMIQEDNGDTGTYKSLGYDIVSAIEDGAEVPYVKREHVAAVPGRADVAAEQVSILEATDQPVPASLARAANPPTDAADGADADETARRPSKR